MMGETKMRWSKERIRDWYNARPWMRGCNYMSADCANRVDQWQELGFEERFQTTEEELKLCKEYNKLQYYENHDIIPKVLRKEQNEHETRI